MFPRGKHDPTKPLASLEDHEAHQYWLIAFPFTDELLPVVLSAGHCRVTLDEHWILMSGSTRDYHSFIRRILDSEESRVRKFGTLLIQSLPDIFKNLGSKMKADGTLALRN